MDYIINGYLWTIRVVPKGNPNLSRSDGSFTLGMCDGAARYIYIMDGLDFKKRRKVLIHEVCHSAMFSYGIHISVEQEEFLCDFIATFGDEIIGIVDGLFSDLRRAA